ncbi:MarC family protein, partial [Escherichia coli]
VAIGALLYLAFRYAQQLLRPLGEAGTVIFLRLSAFILLCLGVQIVWDGASELLQGLLSTGPSRSMPTPAPAAGG